MSLSAGPEPEDAPSMFEAFRIGIEAVPQLDDDDDDDGEWLERDLGAPCLLRADGRKVRLTPCPGQPGPIALSGVFIASAQFGIPSCDVPASTAFAAWGLDENCRGAGFLALPHSDLPRVRALGLPHLVGRAVVLVVATVTAVMPQVALAQGSSLGADGEVLGGVEPAPAKPTWGDLGNDGNDDGEQTGDGDATGTPNDTGADTGADTGTAPTAPPPTNAQPVQTQFIPDSTWNVLMGKAVRVTAGQRTVEGQLAAVDASNVTIIGADGGVNVLPRSSINAVAATDAVAAQPAMGSVYSPKYGSGMWGAGIAVTTIGALAFATGIGLLAYTASSYKIWAPVLVPGIACLAVGIPLMLIGRKKRALQGKPVLQQSRFSIAPIATRRHWGGGLTLRF